MLRPQRAFTLVEILIVLSILAIFATIAVPSFSYLKNTYEANSVIHRLAMTLRIAKLTAITQGQNTIVCPKPYDKKCSSDWSDELVIFFDRNLNRQLDRNELSRKIFPTIEPPNHMIFNGHQAMIRFNSRGFPQGTFGSFTYCPSPMNSEFIRKLIINMQGQIKTEKLSTTERQKLEQECKEVDI